VHAGQVDSVIAASDLFGTGLSPAEADRYVAEMAIAAELPGVPAEQVSSRRLPGSWVIRGRSTWCSG
jgi:hypothetical protein